MTKIEVMKRGRHAPLDLTFSCISPIQGRHCGVCNKCGERQAAFRMLNHSDPTNYHHTLATAGQP